MRQLIAVSMLLLSVATVRAQKFADQLIASGNCEPIVAVTCPSGVENPDYAVDNNPDNYALLKSNLGLSLVQSTAFEEVGFSVLGAPGSEVGIIVEFIDQGLGPQALNNLIVVVYDSAGNEVVRRSDLSLTDVSALSGASDRKIIRVATPLGNYKIGKVRLEMTSLVNASQMMAFYGAYHKVNCPAVLATNIVGNTRNCNNPDFIVDADTGTYGTLSVPLSLMDSAYVTVGFTHAAKAGDFVGFEIAKNQTLLQLGVIDSLTIILLDSDGMELGREDDFTTADLMAVDELGGVLGGLLGMPGASNTRFIIGFNTSSTITKPIAAIKLMLRSTVGLLLDIRVHQGFYYSDLRGVQITADRPGIIGGQAVNLTAENGFQTYSWSNGMTGQTIGVTTPGIYTVSVNRFDGCQLEGSYVVRSLDCAKDGRVYADSLVGFGNCNPQVPLLCPSGVENAQNAVDADKTNYALMSSSLGVSLIESTAFIDLAFPTLGEAGNKIGLMLQIMNENLNVNAVQNLTVYLFDENGDTVKSYSGSSLSNIGLLSGTGSMAVLELPTPFGNYKIARVQVSLVGVANVLQEVGIYGAYYDCACPLIAAVSVDSAVNVLNPEFAVDNDLSNYAQLGTLIGSGNQALLKLAFISNVTAGDYVGVQLEFGNTGASANLVENLTINVYDSNDSLIITYSDLKVTDLVLADQLGGTLGSLLGTGEAGSAPFVIGFVTPPGFYTVGSIEFILNGAVGVAQNLRVYNGFAISQLQGVAISASDSITCKGADITLTAPMGYTSYLWSTGETTQSIQVSEAGLYSVTVGTGSCNLSGSYYVFSRDYGFSFSVNEATCQENNGSATIQVTGGSGNYSFLWSTGDTTATADSLLSGIYTVVVTDNVYGCQDTAKVAVSDSTFEFMGYVRHATCGQNNGAIFLTVPNGYTILWEDGRTTDVITDLAPGDYTVTVTDPSSGCKRVVTYTVISKDDFGITATVTPAGCFIDNGAINITVAEPGNYSFKWSNGATTEDISNLAPGAYTVIVTNLNTGCQDILTTQVSDLGGPLVTLVEAREEVCARDRNGRIEIAVTSAIPYTVDWNNGSTNLKNENLGPGIYVVEVSAGGCTTVAIYELVARDKMAVTVNGTSSDCKPPYNGSVMANVSGGRPEYKYLYNTGDTTANVAGLAPGNYTVQVTDFNGCAAEATGMVSRAASCDEDTTTRKRPKTTQLVTPNGDGFNDFLTLELTADYPQNTFEVFDRDGVLVYETKNYNSDWSGTFRKTSSRLPDGTYFWVFKTKTGKEFRNFFVLKN